jgi:uncharacterized protein (DUF58 family)
MFGPATFALLGLLLAVALSARYAPLFLLALTLLLAAGLSKLWERYCLTGLEYRRHLSQRQAAFGETVVLELEVVNRKLLPLAWLEIEDEIPRSLPPARGRVRSSHKVSRALISNLLALRPYERVRRRYEIRCETRGEHSFGPVRLRTGDLFGLVSRELELEPIDTLVVYPREVPLSRAGLPARQPLGSLAARSWLFDDPSRLIGVRDYRPEDGPRRIHWAASARTQRLQTKVYEPSTDHQLMILLNVTSAAGPDWRLSFDPDVLELAIMTAASIAAWGQARGQPVGFATNGLHRLARPPIRIEPSASAEHFARLRELLGRLLPLSYQRFEQLLAAEGRRLTYGTTAVVVAGGLSPPAAATLRSLRRRGHPVALILTGWQGLAQPLDGVVVRRVGPPDGWRRLSALAIGG